MQWERRIISQRTRDALAAKQAAGVRLGRPRSPQEVVDRIVAARNRGDGLTAIARVLSEQAVPTAQGGARWYPSTVRAILEQPTALMPALPARTVAVPSKRGHP